MEVCVHRYAVGNKKVIREENLYLHFNKEHSKVTNMI